VISVGGMAQLGEWSRIKKSGTIILLCLRRIVQIALGGWCRTIISIRKCSKQSFPREDSFSPGCTVISARRMAQLGEWSRFNNQGHAFPRAYSFSPGCTVISVGGMAQIGERSRLKKIRDNYSSMLDKNSPDSPWMIFLLSKGICFSRSHRCEWRNDPNDSVCILILFMQVDII
jgi:hypothetical protein